MKYIQLIGNPIILRVNDNYEEKDCIVHSQKSGKALYQQQAIDSLKKSIKIGETLYTICRYRSESGITQEVSILYFDISNVVTLRKLHVWDITGLTARILDMKVGKHGGIITKNTARDIIEHLANKLYPGVSPCFDHEVF